MTVIVITDPPKKQEEGRRLNPSPNAHAVKGFTMRADLSFIKAGLPARPALGLPAMPPASGTVDVHLDAFQGESHKRVVAALNIMR